MADSKALVRRHFEEVWNQGKFEGINDIYDAGYQGHIPMLGNVDRDGMKAVVGAFRKAFPDLKFEVQTVIQEGDQVAVRWRASGTSKGEFMGIPATGTFGTINGLSIIELRNGKVGSDHAEMDVLSFMQQLGLQLPVGGKAAAPAPSEEVHATH